VTPDSVKKINNVSPFKHQKEDNQQVSRESNSQNSVQHIVRTLEVDIVLGRLYPRERLVEEQLAKRFETSRHVVRQALLELEIAGLVVREANKGSTICEYGAEEVRQLYQMREIVERQAAMLIRLPVAPESHEMLAAICEEHDAAINNSDMLRVVAANKEFHQVLYRLCGNPFLADVIDEMAKKANLVRFTSSTDLALLKQARDEHYQILNALKKDDNKALADMCVGHLQPSRQMYLEKRGHLS
jgi:DNA-binding GntR family transcriptional regulator